MDSNCALRDQMSSLIELKYGLMGNRVDWSPRWIEICCERLVFKTGHHRIKGVSNWSIAQFARTIDFSVPELIRVLSYMFNVRWPPAVLANIYGRSDELPMSFCISNISTFGARRLHGSMPLDTRFAEFKENFLSYLNQNAKIEFPYSKPNFKETDRVEKLMAAYQTKLAIFAEFPVFSPFWKELSTVRGLFQCLLWVISVVALLTLVLLKASNWLVLVVLILLVWAACFVLKIPKAYQLQLARSCTLICDFVSFVRESMNRESLPLRTLGDLEGVNELRQHQFQD